MATKADLAKKLRDMRPVGSLILLPDNPRHGDIGAISQSLERFGQQKPIVINSDGVILAGNHTFQAAKALGWDEIWVAESELEGVDQPGFALADNRLSDLATYDHDALLKMMKEQPDLLGTGYDEQDMAEIAGDLTYQKQGYDGEVREPPKEPITKLGDVWLLDNHTVHCADAFKVELAEHSCLLTDPPYAIFGSSTGASSSAADDRMIEPFFASLMRKANTVLPVGGHAYVHCDWRSWSALWNAARGTDMQIKNMLVWDKQSPGMGTNYTNGFELLAFIHHWPERRSLASQEPDRNFRPVMGQSNILQFPRESEKLHNAAKPVPLLEQLIKNSTEEGGTVLDLFAGSGSTLIAAANVGRVGTMVEIEPGWCDVIVDRYRDVYPDADIRKA